MIEAHLMLSVYSDFYKGYSVHAESDLTTTHLYLTSGIDTHPRLYLDELSNVDVVNMKYEGTWEQYLKGMITKDVECQFSVVNDAYPES